MHMEAMVSVPDGVLIRELEGESVLLNLNSESYFGLDDVGTRMWAALATARTLQGAFEILLAEYDVDPAQLRADLGTFVEKLSELGLLRVGEV